MCTKVRRKAGHLRSSKGCASVIHTKKGDFDASSVGSDEVCSRVPGVPFSFAVDCTDNKHAFEVLQCLGGIG
jgi:hypothetical protein